MQLSAADRRWIDFITQEVNDTWDDSNPGRPKTMGYVGSEEFIRLQFEEYLLSLISSVKYHTYMARHGNNPRMMLPHIEGDPSTDFGTEFVECWMRTENYRLWSSNTEPNLFDIVEPRHPCAGGMTIDDVQRRIAQQVQDLHLDERFAQGREVIGSTLAAGKERASTMLNKLYGDMEALRETQRRRAEEARREQQPLRPTLHERNGSNFSAIDIGKAQQTMQSVGVRAGAYMSSWATWAGEKRKTGWGRASGGAAGNGSGSGGWGLMSPRSIRHRNTMSSTASDASSEKDLQMSRISMSSTMTGMSENEKLSRRVTQSSFSESVLDTAASERSLDLASPISRPLSDESLAHSARGIDSVVTGPMGGSGADKSRRDAPSTPPPAGDGNSPPKATGSTPPLKIEKTDGDNDEEVGSPLKERPVQKRRDPLPVGSKVMLRP